MSDPRWYLILLGGSELRGDNAAAAESIVVQPKHVGLVTYLELATAERQRFARRDRLAALFWPELDQLHARTALRRVVHQIRSALGADTLLSRGDEELALNEAAIGSDVRDFARAISRSELARALELYAGELLPGFHVSGCLEFERWLDAERDNLRREAGATAWALAQRFESERDFSMAGQIARRAARFAWDDERMLRRAMAMLDRLGDRSGSLRLFAEFSRRLRDEFDAEPSPETVALAGRLRGSSTT